MSENNTEKPWFFMREYPNPNEEPTTESDVAEPEARLYQKLQELDDKLDKVIQSQKSLIAYFTAINDRDARDLNYKLRSYSSKKIAPVGFVPERRSDL